MSKKPQGRTPPGTFPVWVVSEMPVGARGRDAWRNRIDLSVHLSMEEAQRHIRPGTLQRVRRQCVREIHGMLYPMNALPLKVRLNQPNQPNRVRVANVNSAWTRNTPDSQDMYWWWSGDEAEKLRTQVDNLTKDRAKLIQEVWEAAGGSPDCRASKSDLLGLVKQYVVVRNTALKRHGF